jgi:hypothetical protein
VFFHFNIRPFQLMCNNVTQYFNLMYYTTITNTC